MKKILYILSLVVLLSVLVPQRASAQYYSWGADPSSMRWNRMRGDKTQIIFPDTARMSAYRLMHYIEAVQPTIGEGFRHGPMDIPFIVHPENAMSNGLVMWLPKRVEIISSPAIDSYSMPWLKQLAAHEYRHAVQYNNLNRGAVRIFSYILGQQSSTIGLLFMPLWAMEGDAVETETAMSSFGRALQPSFTMHYRALGESILDRKNMDRWFCGSYRDYIPDHYQMGYQITSYANTKYDENIWNKVVRYAVRNPYVFATTWVAMRRYYNTDVGHLTREAFSDLNAYWAQLPKVDDSATRLPTPRQRSYTRYRYPMPFVDGEGVLSFKTSLDKPTALVVTDSVGNERRLCYTGAVSSRQTIGGGKVWWTEYRRSLLFEQRVNSRMCYIDLTKNHARTVFRYRNVIYPTAIDGSEELAWVEYQPDGDYFVVRGDTKSSRQVARAPFGAELHALAYDNLTRALYVIVTSDDGMWLGRVNEQQGRIDPLTHGAYITISDLRAHDGWLYFGSIASGKDEAHCYNLLTGKEYRISTSRYGSFSPSPTDDGRILLTTYDKDGYHLAEQRVDSVALQEVIPSRLPVNLVNPPRKRWNVVNLDTVRFAAADSVRTIEQHRSKRYTKMGHLFKVHSWAPVSYDPFQISEEGMFDFNLGATIMSQNLLSTAEGFLTWGWNQKEGSLYKGALRYYGLGVNLEVNASYGGTQKLYTAYTYELKANGRYELVFPDSPKLDKYYNVGASITVPLNFQLGYRTHYVGFTTAWNYSNGLVAKVRGLQYDGGQITNLAKIGYTEGLHLLQFGIGYQCLAQMAHRDFLPRFGHVLSINYALNPADSAFGDLFSLYGKIYLPGILPHHSLSMALNYQDTYGGFQSDLLASNMTFSSTRLRPHGYYPVEIYNQRYVATSLNYSLPIWSPEGGIGSILYFKRIRLNLGFEFASFDQPFFKISSGAPVDITSLSRPALMPDFDGVIEPNPVHMNSRRKNIYAYGGELSFDINLFRMPSSATSALNISIYKPKGKSVVWGVGLGLPF